MIAQSWEITLKRLYVTLLQPGIFPKQEVAKNLPVALPVSLPFTGLKVYYEG